LTGRIQNCSNDSVGHIGSREEKDVGKNKMIQGEKGCREKLKNI
jgi:hypothetical protein